MKIAFSQFLIVTLFLQPLLIHASPESDLKRFRTYFEKRFPKLKLKTFNDGIYALDADRRQAWQEWIEFAPPYSDGLDYGKKLFHTKFKNGKSYASCFKNAGIGIRHHFPYFDAKSGRIITLEYAINDCRIKNGEQAYPWGKGDLAAISAYMAYTSKGRTINIKVPKDPRALAVYQRGKQYYFAKRGQLNFACADCHFFNSGNMLRGHLLSPAIGQTTHFPAWRRKWANAAEANGDQGPARGFGTLQRRYRGCNNQVRAKPYPFQSEEYQALEYFHQYLSRGLQVNGPGLRQ